MAKRRLHGKAARIVQAPEPTLAPSARLPPNRVTSVILESGEDVAWIWTSTPDGASYVSGYTIVKRKPTTG